MAAIGATNPLRLAHDYADGLRNMISLSFGPDGGLIIIEEPGALFVTGDGSKLLEGYGAEQPVSKLILQSVKALKKVEGDGIKRFILILQPLLKSLCSMFEKNSSTHFRRITFISFLDYFERVIMEELQKKLLTLFVPFRFCSLNEGFFNFLRRIIEGSLEGKLPRSTCDKLSALLEEYIKGSCSHVDNLGMCLKEAIRNLESRSIHVQNGIFGDSRILDGLLITRDFAVECDFDQFVNRSSHSFIILKLRKTEEVTTHLEASSKQSLSDALWWKMKIWNLYLLQLKRYGVKFILSCDGLEEFSVRSCKSEGISVIHHIDPVEMERIVHCAGVTVCLSIEDGIEADNIGEIKSIKKIVLDSNVNIIIHLGTANKEFLFFGPTLAMTKQYSQAVCDILKILQSSMHFSKADSVEFYSIPAHGYAELVLNYLLRKHDFSTHSNGELTHFEDYCKYIALFSDALLSVPKTLIQNSGGKKRVIEIQHEIAMSLERGCCPRLSSTRAVEPLFLSLNLLKHATVLLRRLTRIECIVPVKRLLPAKDYVGERCDSP